MLLPEVGTLILTNLSVRPFRKSITTFLSNTNISGYLPFSSIIQFGSEIPAVKQCFCNLNAFGNTLISAFNHGWCLALTSFVLTGTHIADEHFHSHHPVSRSDPNRHYHYYNSKL